MILFNLIDTDLNSDDTKYALVIFKWHDRYKAIRGLKLYSIHKDNILTRKLLKKYKTDVEKTV